MNILPSKLSFGILFRLVMLKCNTVLLNWIYILIQDFFRTFCCRTLLYLYEIEFFRFWLILNGRHLNLYFFYCNKLKCLYWFSYMYMYVCFLIRILICRMTKYEFKIYLLFYGDHLEFHHLISTKVAKMILLLCIWILIFIIYILICHTTIFI